MLAQPLSGSTISKITPRASPEERPPGGSAGCRGSPVTSRKFRNSEGSANSSLTTRPVKGYTSAEVLPGPYGDRFMNEVPQERKIHIRLSEDLHRRLRVRCAEIDSNMQEYVVRLLERELMGGDGDTSPPSNSSSRGRGQGGTRG